MDREVINYLPPILRDVSDFKAINIAENDEFSLLWQNIQDILNSAFLKTTSEMGVKKLERILSITPKGSDSLEVRKFRLYAKLSEGTPKTIVALSRQLEELCGSDGFSIEINGFTLKVLLGLAQSNLFSEVKYLIERTIPANLVLDLSLLYNTHSKYFTYTHGQLAAYTHENLRSDGV